MDFTKVKDYGGARGPDAVRKAYTQIYLKNRGKYHLSFGEYKLVFCDGDKNNKMLYNLDLLTDKEYDNWRLEVERNKELNGKVSSLSEQEKEELTGMVTCKHCGNKIEKDFILCLNCGEDNPRFKNRLSKDIN